MQPQIIIREGRSEKAMCEVCGNKAMCNITINKMYICWRCVEENKNRINFNPNMVTKNA